MRKCESKKNSLLRAQIEDLCLNFALGKCEFRVRVCSEPISSETCTEFCNEKMQNQNRFAPNSSDHRITGSETCSEFCNEMMQDSKKKIELL